LSTYQIHDISDRYRHDVVCLSMTFFLRGMFVKQFCLTNTHLYNDLKRLYPHSRSRSNYWKSSCD